MSTKSNSQLTNILGSASWTNVPLTTSLFFGVLLTMLFYSMLPWISSLSLAGYFYERGWIPLMEAFFFFTAMGSLMMKRRMIRYQQNVRIDQLLSSKPEIIDLKNVQTFIEQISDLDHSIQRSYLAIRVLRALQHFEWRKKRTEVDSFLASQSAIDQAMVESSYTLVKVIIWAIPILGFMGTVLGIGQSIEGFSSLTDVENIESSLSVVTAGMSGAFDTTFIALVMSVITMVFASTLQKREQDLLTHIDDLCNESLMRRIQESASNGFSNNDQLDAFFVSQGMNDAASSLGERFLSVLTALEEAVHEFKDRVTNNN